jgi:hypothetical protein
LISLIFKNVKEAYENILLSITHKPIARARQELYKHVPMAMDTHTTIAELKNVAISM